MTYSQPAYQLVTPQVIGTSSPWCGMSTFLTGAGAIAPADLTGNAANMATYVPFLVTTPATFRRGFWWNGSVPDATCNVDVGIYTPDGTKRASTGSVAKSGASVIQTAAFTASYDAAPGQYYMAIIYSVGADAAGIFGRAADLPSGKLSGLYQQAVGSFPLPTNATFAAWTAQVIPHFGIAQTTFAI